MPCKPQVGSYQPEGCGLSHNAGFSGSVIRPVRLTISVLGGLRISAGEDAIDIRSRKARALLAHLALGPTGSETRARLCGLLWSESDEPKARASLRQTLHGLTEDLRRHGFEGLDSSREMVILRPGTFTCDTGAVFEELAARRIPEPLVTLAQPADALLAGYDDVDPAFDTWLKVQRRLLGERLERAIRPCYEHAATSAERIAAARALLNLDRTNEVACRDLMTILAQRGEVAAALKAYNDLWAYLDNEYDAEPSGETQALAICLKAEPMPIPVQAPPVQLPIPAPARERAVIVERFGSEGVEPRDAYLVGGLRQDLLSRLVRFREWAVIDGAHVPVAGRETFDARWPDQVWIEGFVAQQGSELNLTFTIRQQPGARLIWGDTVRLGLDGWFELGQTLLMRIATVMNLHISTARLLETAQASDVSLELYDRWLRGQAIIMNWQPERNRARAIFRAILQEAPGFSPAHSSLAQLENSEHLSLPGVFRSDAREASGLAHARQAVRLDPLDSRAHLALGWASLLTRQFDSAYLAFTTALELNPSDPWTLHSAALGCAYAGDTGQAIAALETSVGFGLQPTAFHAAYQGAIRFAARDYAGAVDAYDQAGDLIADLAAWKAASLVQLGRTEEAADAIKLYLADVRKRWTSSEPPTDSRLAAWFLHCFPMRDRQVWERLRDGVQAAGLAVPPEAEIPRHP